MNRIWFEEHTSIPETLLGTAGIVSGGAETGNVVVIAHKEALEKAKGAEVVIAYEKNGEPDKEVLDEATHAVYTEEMLCLLLTKLL